MSILGNRKQVLKNSENDAIINWLDLHTVRFLSDLSMEDVYNVQNIRKLYSLFHGDKMVMPFKITDATYCSHQAWIDVDFPIPQQVEGKPRIVTLEDLIQNSNDDGEVKFHDRQYFFSRLFVFDDVPPQSIIKMIIPGEHICRDMPVVDNIMDTGDFEKSLKYFQAHKSMVTQLTAPVRILVGKIEPMNTMAHKDFTFNARVGHYDYPVGLKISQIITEN